MNSSVLIKAFFSMLVITAAIFQLAGAVSYYSNIWVPIQYNAYQGLLEPTIFLRQSDYTVWCLPKIKSFRTCILKYVHTGMLVLLCINANTDNDSWLFCIKDFLLWRKGMLKRCFLLSKTKCKRKQLNFIHSDQWKGYSKLPDHGYVHKTVNHTVNNK